MNRIIFEIFFTYVTRRNIIAESEMGWFSDRTRRQVAEKIEFNELYLFMIKSMLSDDYKVG